MHIRSGFLLKEVSDGYAAIPFEGNYENLGTMISLNETGAFLWQLLENDIEINELEIAMMQRYNVEHEIAKKAVSEFIKSLRECDLL